MAGEKDSTNTTQAPDAIRVDIDLGPVKPTPEQIELLKSQIKNRVLTWVTEDLNAPIIVCEEFIKPGPDAGDDDEEE